MPRTRSEGEAKPMSEARLKRKEAARAGKALIDKRLNDSRPATVTPRSTVCEEAGIECLDYVRQGGTIAEYARRSGLSYYAIAKYVQRRPESLKEARRQGAHALVDEAIRIANEPLYLEETVETTDPQGGVTRTVKRADAVQARKLAVWARLEVAKAWNPEEYGNKVQVDAGDSFTNMIAAAKRRVQASRDAVDAEVIGEGSAT